jgi:hypothetical protein
MESMESESVWWFRDDKGVNAAVVVVTVVVVVVVVGGEGLMGLLITELIVDIVIEVK